MSAIFNDVDASSLPATLLPLGQKAMIKRILASGFECKLLAMGILPGKELTMIRKAPFGGAWYATIDGQNIALRNEEAKSILTQKLV